MTTPNTMTALAEDIYTEPSNIDVDMLRNVGPLSGMAGIWKGTRGLDVKPKAEGPNHDQVGYWLWEPAWNTHSKRWNTASR